MLERITAGQVRFDVGGQVGFVVEVGFQQAVGAGRGVLAFLAALEPLGGGGCRREEFTVGVGQFATHVEVQVQFVVCGGFVIKDDVAQQARVVPNVRALFNQTQGVFRGQRVGFVVPNPLEVAAQGSISAVNGPSGVKSDRRTDGAGVGVILGGVDQFTGEVGFQFALDQFG